MAVGGFGHLGGPDHESRPLTYPVNPAKPSRASSREYGLAKVQDLATAPSGLGWSCIVATLRFSMAQPVSRRDNEFEAKGFDAESALNT